MLRKRKTIFSKKIKMKIKKIHEAKHKCHTWFIYVVHSKGFQTFFVQALKIVVDS